MHPQRPFEFRFHSEESGEKKVQKLVCYHETEAKSRL